MHQQPVRPGSQVLDRGLRAVGDHLVDPPVDLLVVADVVPWNVKVVLSDGIDPRIHSCPADASLQRGKVPFLPHFAVRIPLQQPDVQNKRMLRQVIIPVDALQRICHGLDRVVNAQRLEFIREAVNDLQVSQLPVEIPAQQVFDRLPRRAARPAADVLRRHLAEDLLILQQPDHMLQLDRHCVRLAVFADALDPPDDRITAGHVFVIQPVVEINLDRAVHRHRDRARAAFLRQGQALAFRQEPRPPRKGMPL